MGFSQSVHYELMIRAAYYYYQREYTQTKIAEMLGVSRLTLGRILKEARETGVVKIQISDPRNLTSLLELESGLCDRFGLENAIVSDPIGRSSDDINRTIASSAAQYVSRTIRSGMKLSLSWGRTLDIMVDMLQPDRTIKDLEISALIGGANTTDTYVQSGMLASRFLSGYSGKGYVINAPFICQSEEVGLSMRNEPGVRDVLEKGAASDIAIIGIGERPSFDNKYWARKNYDNETLKAIIRSGAVGDICGCYIDEDGNPCCPEINRRLVGISIDGLKKHRYVVAVAGGEGKVDSIKAALKRGFIKLLITDCRTAEEILK